MDRLATATPLPSLSLRASTARSSMIRDLLHVLEQPHVLSLAGGLPAAEAMPAERLRLALDRALDEQGRYGPAALQYGPTEGAHALRELIAATAHEHDTRTTVDGVITTTGSQQALDLLARVLLDPGDVVVVEHPAYLGSLQVLTAAGARIVEVQSDADGMRTDALEQLLCDGLRPKLCTVVPNFQNPTGSTLSHERRVHLAALADHYGFVVVEDDPYRALRFRGDDVAPVRANSDLAVTLGSSSKVLAPGLRVGWLAGPPELVRHVVRAKQSVDLHTPMLNQLAVADVLRDRSFLTQHVRRLRALYSLRCEALTTALAAVFGEHIEIEAPEGGFFVWARLPGTDTAALLPLALDEGVAFVPGAEFTTRTGELGDRMRLSFASLDGEGLAEAATRMAAAYSRRHADHGRPRGGQRLVAHEPRPSHRARG
jgi:2-aminoadipate transaminase